MKKLSIQVFTLMRFAWAVLFSFSILGLCSTVPSFADSLEKQLEAHLFRPEHLKEHRHDLKLSTAQVEEISRAIGQAEGRLTELQWRLEDASRALVETVVDRQPDEATVLEKAEEVLGLENQIKLQQLKLLVVIKGALTAEQQDHLRELTQ